MICKFEAFKFFKFYNIEINTVLDIGAHKGKWTQTFKEHYPNVKALMIEANEDHIDDLIRTGHYIVALIGKDNEEVDYYMCEDKNNTEGNGIYRENTNVLFWQQLKIYTSICSCSPSIEHGPRPLGRAEGEHVGRVRRVQCLHVPAPVAAESRVKHVHCTLRCFVDVTRCLPCRLDRLPEEYVGDRSKLTRILER
jgi:hypothetical protein